MGPPRFWDAHGRHRWRLRLLYHGNERCWDSGHPVVRAHDRSAGGAHSNPFTTFTVGAAGLFTATSTGYPTPTLGDTGPWPSGVAFHDNGDGTGTLSGTPGTGTGGIYDSTLSAQNGVGSPATQSFALTVNEAPWFTSSAATTFTSGSASSFDFTTLGWPLPSYTETGTLPAGVTFVDNGNGTATLAGTPAAGTGGVYTFSVEASNSVTSTTETFTLTIDQQAVITSGSSATFVIGTAGSFSVDRRGTPHRHSR